MRTTSSSEAQKNLVAMLDEAQHEPIAVQKQGRNVAVLISYEEFERLTSIHRLAFQIICDNVGAKAESRGLTEEKLMEFLAEND